MAMVQASHHSNTSLERDATIKPQTITLQKTTSESEKRRERERVSARKGKRPVRSHRTGGGTDAVQLFWTRHSRETQYLHLEPESTSCCHQPIDGKPRRSCLGPLWGRLKNFATPAFRLARRVRHGMRHVQSGSIWRRLLRLHACSVADAWSHSSQTHSPRTCGAQWSRRGEQGGKSVLVIRWFCMEGPSLNG